MCQSFTNSTSAPDIHVPMAMSSFLHFQLSASELSPIKSLRKARGWGGGKKRGERRVVALAGRCAPLRAGPHTAPLLST